MKKLIASFVLFFVSPCLSEATVYWASPTGSNTATCTNIDSTGTADSPGTDPGSYGTIGRAAQCATVAGDVVNIKAGTYTSVNDRIDTAFSGGTVTSTGLKSGTDEAVRTYVQGDPSGARPLVQGRRFYCTFSGASRNYITIRHLKLDENYGGGACSATIGVEGHHVTITDNEILNSQDMNILIGTSCISASCTHTEAQYAVVTYNVLHTPGGDGTGYGIYSTQNNPTVEHNEIYSFKGFAIHIYSDFGPVNNPIIRYNYIHDALRGRQTTTYIPCGGIIVNGSGSIVHRNVIDLSTCESDSDTSSPGIVVGYNTAAAADITHNLIYRSRGYGIRIGSTPTGATTIYNNILFGNIVAAVSISPSFTGSVTYTHNACESTATCTTSNKTTISAITDITASTSNFTHKSASSGIDVGKVLSGAYNGSAPDLGPFEVPVFGSCQISTGTTIEVTMTNNVNPPMLPASSATTFTARKNGSANTVSSVSRVGDNMYQLTTSSSYVAGNTGDISWASGNLTDSALIGNTLNQGVVTAISNQSCVNNVAGASYTLTQAAYRLHSLFGTEAAPVILPYGVAGASAENFSSFTVFPGSKIRIRFSVTCASAACDDTGFNLYYSKNGGSYTSIPNTAGADAISFCGSLSGIPSNGSATTNLLTTAGTFTAGGFVSTSNAIPTVTGLVSGGKTENEYCVALSSSASSGDTYDFRMYKQTGSALDTYSNTPRLSVIPMAFGY